MFEDVETEYSMPHSAKSADIVVLKSGKLPVFVIETKRTFIGGKVTYKINPFSEAVIKQAKGYATDLMIDYYATFNGKFFVIFKNDKSKDCDDPLYPLEVYNLNDFCASLFELIADTLNNEKKPITLEDLYSQQLSAFFDLIYPQYSCES